jgi:hypothetical protein
MCLLVEDPAPVRGKTSSGRATIRFNTLDDVHSITQHDGRAKPGLLNDGFMAPSHALTTPLAQSIVSPDLPPRSLVVSSADARDPDRTLGVATEQVLFDFGLIAGFV